MPTSVGAQSPVGSANGSGSGSGSVSSFFLSSAGGSELDPSSLVEGLAAGNSSHCPRFNLGPDALTVSLVLTDDVDAGSDPADGDRPSALSSHQNTAMTRTRITSSVRRRLQ
jgi:hypothetical protein